MFLVQDSWFRVRRESLLKIMETKSNRILVSSFASNVARMESIFYCAKKTGRSISLVGRSMQRIYKAAKKCGYRNLNNRTKKYKNISKKKFYIWLQEAKVNQWAL